TGVLLTVLIYNSLSWVDATFPGFFVLQNRIVASIALPDWPDASRLFQRQVVAIDGKQVASSDAIYQIVRSKPASTRFCYTLRQADGELSEECVRSRAFSRSNYAFLFGSFALSGCTFLLTGLLVFLLKPKDQASRALLASGLGIGVFALTALDLYGPHWFFRLHVVGEVMVSPGFIHLAAVFPTDRIWRRRRLALVGLYAPFILLTLWYERVLQDPTLYTQAHLAATVAQAVAGLALVLSVCHALLTTHSPLVRRRLAVVALGTACGFVIPILLMAASGLLGGTVAINGAALTTFFFPLSLGYGVVKQNLFDLDVMLRRAISYGVVVLAIAVVYFVTLYFFGVMVPGQLSAWSPVVLAVINFVLLFWVAPMRERVQRAVDRVFFRQTYQIEEALSALSHLLASAHALDAVVGHVRSLLNRTISPTHFQMYLRSGEAWKAADAHGVSGLEVDANLEKRLNGGEILLRYEWDDGSGRYIPPVWKVSGADLLVPVRTGGAMIALLALGPKSSGNAYSVNDSTFLRTASNQMAMALANAAAYSQLEELNANLERKVHERMAEQNKTNAELNLSIEKLREAYERLEDSQASLLRADRLATLGRLTAGIAHEMNTPLSAVLNALKILGDLGTEYKESIGDSEVLPEDHRQIAMEVIATAESATRWAKKAASYISSVKAHGREGRPTVKEPIAIETAVVEVRALLAHRLRSAACQIDFEENALRVQVVGDAARLGQVLLNLCGNAIEAYEDHGFSTGRILVSATRGEDNVILRVRDWAGGIPEDVLPRIFEELYTTKGPGRGTGLGLWIARNLVEQGFGGTLMVESRKGEGSCFIATFPVNAAMAEANVTGVGGRPSTSPVAVLH
ncbi:MAG TPA: ATP-binding protein, partial [Candidatus Acidoferrales bacterium]|nr:ATP-binding protein [Candidatus Acidoferrales bacterium]